MATQHAEGHFSSIKCYEDYKSKSFNNDKKKNAILSMQLI